MCIINYFEFLHFLLHRKLFRGALIFEIFRGGWEWQNNEYTSLNMIFYEKDCIKGIWSLSVSSVFLHQHFLKIDFLKTLQNFNNNDFYLSNSRFDMYQFSLSKQFKDLRYCSKQTFLFLCLWSYMYLLLLSK